MNTLRTPEGGCFVANYPKPTWRPTQCATADSEPGTVGNGHDYVLAAPSGQLLTQVQGSFPVVSGLTWEHDSKQSANWYSLQINSNSGSSFPVTGFGVPGLTGWEQFMYRNSPNNGHVFIEYWLSPYFNKTGHCPTQVPPGGGRWYNDGNSCFFNTAGLFTPSVPAKNLKQLTLDGGAYASNDLVVVCISVTCYTSNVPTSFLGLYKYWNHAEFNVVGFQARSQAVFNTGTSIAVEDTVEAPSFASPVICLLGKGGEGGMTGETNNLNIVSCMPGNHAIVFGEGN